jgi:hypothetical protein
MDQMIQSLRAKATSQNREAWDELERRGLKFLAHFGYENADEVLREMNMFVDMGLLYWWLQHRLGINVD